MRRATLLVTLAALAAPSAAYAQEDPVVAPAPAAAPPVAAAPPADVAPPRASSRPDVLIGIGVRGMLIPSKGLDPYAGDNLLMQGSLTAGLTVLRAGSASLLLFAEWNIGSRSDQARGEAASLTLHRFAGGLETRYQLARRLYLGAKLAPAAFYMRGSIVDGGLDRPLVSRAWTWGLDAAGSAGLLVLGSPQAGGPKLWVTLDLGYTFAGEHPMSYAPGADDTDPRKYGAVMLPALKPSGAMSRLGASITF